MVARCLRFVARGRGGGPSPARRQQQPRPHAQARQKARSFRQGVAQAVFLLPVAAASAGTSSIAIQVSFLLDTDLLSLLERKRVPANLVLWLAQHDSDLFVSVVSLAELELGLRQAPVTHRPGLAAWLTETRQKFSQGTEQLTEPLLVRWKELLVDLKRRNRTMTCEDSLIAATALFHGHTLATHNQRHFEPAGVQIIDPLL